MTGRHLEHPGKQSAVRHRRAGGLVMERLMIPARGHARREQRLDLRSDVERVAMPGVEKRLDPKTVAGGKQSLLVAIPDDEGEFAAQLRQAMRPDFFVEVQRDLTV